jgi:hypothetical protein
VDGAETEIDVTGMSTASHTVSSLTAGKSYSFTIAAVAGSAESTQSTAVTATPTPPAVSGLAATAGAEEVALSWTASTVTGVTGYKIRQTVDGTETEIDVTGASTASHTVSSLTAGHRNRDRCKRQSDYDSYGNRLNHREELQLHHSSSYSR